MRAVVQRVSEASVTVDDMIVGNILGGLLVLLGVEDTDTESDSNYLADKTASLRIFPDQEDRMNLSVSDIGGGILVVSQFTLFGDCRKGRRPSYNNAASPELAEKLYNHFVNRLRTHVPNVSTGKFQAMMQVGLINDGPVTILLDSKKLF
ncbi:MAG: D-tyrosyl-tRNA(Tyr) deacylase [Proteobacteria bacterium]|nr:D-tyrosyl-tRNA(Tyr) deacylase [Pseudomonadota bacterium]MBU1739626.1 D-tyrosyl-tRNA(Tyr) deacylase [Pseudomonadota bacterium]